MKTVKDFLKYKEYMSQTKQQKCDEWLENIVFPKFAVTGNGTGFTCPNFATMNEVVLMLRQRGWEVKDYTGYQGSFLYLSIPPQGE